MKRKDLYVEIYNTVLTEVHIADRDTLTEILESLSIYKFTDAFSSLLPSLNGDKSYLKNFVEKIKDCSNDPNIDLEEEIDNPFDFASFEMVEASRKVHLHKFYHYNIDCIELHDIDKKSGHPSIKGMEQISEQIKEFMVKKTK